MVYREILDLISKGLLECALDKLKAAKSATYENELESICTTYGYMKEYMLDNVDDPQREILFGKLLCQTYELLNAIYIDEESASNNGMFFQKIRYYRSQNKRSVNDIRRELETYSESLSVNSLLDGGKYSAEDNRRHEENFRELFYLLWINTRWTAKDAEDVAELFRSGLVQTNDKVLALSAILESLLTFFDIRKYMFIIDCCQSDDKEIKGRATVILLIVSNAHDGIINLYPEAKARLRLLDEDAVLREALATNIIQFLKTLDTKSIDRKFKEEIIPELMKKQSELKDRAGNEMIDENSFNEMNPEWQADMENSPLARKIKEIGELQEEGFDVYMGTFSQLKTFPFFREIPNWFYPFSTLNSEIHSLFPENGSGKATLMSTLLKSRSLCDSDKYSFCFTLTQVPASQREMLTAQIDSQIEQQINSTVSEEQTAAHISNTYIQNLYRFHNLNSHRAEFVNIFKDVTLLAETRSLKHLTDTPQTNLMIAEFLFKNSHYVQSYPFYKKYMDESKCNDSRILQRIGYNAQRLGLYEEAANLYTTADSLSPNNTWILSHLAYCYTMTGDIGRALEFYRLISLLQPGNNKITLQICKCLIKDRQYKKATEHLYKIYFEEPENAGAIRMLGWCMLELGNREDALKFFNKLSESKATLTANDHANTAHALWINGRARDAMNEYRKCREISQDVFEAVIKDDAQLLAKYGIGNTDIMIMKDIILSN